MTITPPPSPAGLSPAGPGPQAGHQVVHQERAPGQAETLFVPIKPCPIVDTRRGGGALADNVACSFYVTSTAGFSGQGGTVADAG